MTTDATSPASFAAVQPAAGDRLRVAAIAWAGYLFLPLLALALLAIPAAVLVSGNVEKSFAHFVLLGVLCVLPAVRIFRAMVFKQSEPEGVVLQAADAPELFRMIETVRTSISAPQVDAVYITGDLNAAAAQRASRGLFGGWRNELIIGLPLLMAHERDEIAGIIAHELGHFAGSHGKLHARVCKTGAVWCEAARRENVVAAIAQWYLPRLSLVASRHARANEYAADMCEVAVVGSECAARSLCRSIAAGHVLCEFWSSFFRANVTGEKPSVMPHAAMAETLGNAVEWTGASEALAEAMKSETDPHDDHPCLKDRLEMVGGVCALPRPVAHPGSVLLGPALERVTRELDEEWWADIREEWQLQGRRQGKLQRLDTKRARASAPEGPWTRTSVSDAEAVQA